MGGGGGGGGGGLWGGANGGGVMPFCVPENRGLHKIAYLRGHVFLCLPVSFPQKKNNTINNPLGNAVNEQILGILATSVH